jgi:hypothetical protein
MFTFFSLLQRFAIGSALPYAKDEPRGVAIRPRSYAKQVAAKQIRLHTQKQEFFKRNIENICRILNLSRMLHIHTLPATQST